MSERKAIVRYPHRCQTAKCKGVMPDPAEMYGAFAHWHPLRQVWLSRPTCPACLYVKDSFNAGAGPGNSYSRYASQYICSECGTKEAFEGFFWRNKCDPRKIKEHHREKTDG